MRSPRTRIIFLVLLASVFSAPAAAEQFQVGDVFAAVGDADLDGQAEIFHYRADGTFVETLSFGFGIGGRSTGMAFDARGNLLATAFDRSKVLRFDHQGENLGVVIGSGLSYPESIVLDGRGDFYVSSVLSPVGIKKFDADGKQLAEFIPGTRVDWMDLAPDQRTILFTQEADAILSVDVGNPAGTRQFAEIGGTCYALRTVANGAVLVANGANIKLLSSAGALIRSYDVAGEDRWFAVNIDPDGVSFWSGNIDSGRLYKFDIVCGGAVKCTTFAQMIATGVPNEQPTRALAGLAIYGELSANSRPSPTSRRRMVAYPGPADLVGRSAPRWRHAGGPCNDSRN